MSHENVTCRENAMTRLVEKFVSTANHGILLTKYRLVPCVYTRVKVKL